MFPREIETERLDLRKFCGDEVEVFELYDLFAARNQNIDDVFEYVPREPYSTVTDARDQLDTAEAQWDDGAGAWYAIYTPDEELAGYAVLNVKWDRKTGDLGLVLGKNHWGNGFAGECLRVLTELSLDRLDLELVATGYESGNERSERAVEKFVDAVGGQYDGVVRNRTPVGDEIPDHHRYTVTREQYRDAVAD
jgi:RimJ/RimL family protein N-acetyltransferase